MPRTGKLRVRPADHPAGGGNLNPTITYDSAHQGLGFVTEARALWEYRHLVVELVIRDIKVRYKRSVLGVGWTMLSPLLNMVALTLVFSALLRQEISNYPVYFLTGSLCWTFFAQATSHAATLTVDALEITRRIYVPRSVFVASAIGVALVNLVLSLVPLLLIILATGFRLHLMWVYLPISMLMTIAFTGGVGLLVFTMASRFSDVKETYLVLLSTWFFLTPVVYAPTIVPLQYRIFVKINPMTHLVEMFRRPLYGGILPSRITFVLALVSSSLALVLGWLFYSAKNEEYGTRG